MKMFILLKRFVLIFFVIAHPSQAMSERTQPEYDLIPLNKSQLCSITQEDISVSPDLLLDCPHHGHTLLSNFYAAIALLTAHYKTTVPTDKRMGNHNLDVLDFIKRTHKKQSNCIDLASILWIAKTRLKELTLLPSPSETEIISEKTPSISVFNLKTLYHFEKKEEIIRFILNHFQSPPSTPLLPLGLRLCSSILETHHISLIEEEAVVATGLSKLTNQNNDVLYCIALQTFSHEFKSGLYNLEVLAEHMAYCYQKSSTISIVQLIACSSEVDHLQNEDELNAMATRIYIEANDSVALERLLDRMPHRIEDTREGCPSPLQVALVEENQPILQLLLDRGVNLNVHFNRNQTALFSALYIGNVEIFKLLCQSKADIHAINNDGRTLLQEAERCQLPRIVDFLKEKAAEDDSKKRKISCHQMHCVHHPCFIC